MVLWKRITAVETWQVSNRRLSSCIKMKKFKAQKIWGKTSKSTPYYGFCFRWTFWFDKKRTKIVVIRHIFCGKMNQKWFCGRSAARTLLGELTPIAEIRNRSFAAEKKGRKWKREEGAAEMKRKRKGKHAETLAGYVPQIFQMVEHPLSEECHTLVHRLNFKHRLGPFANSSPNSHSRWTMAPLPVAYLSRPRLKTGQHIGNLEHYLEVPITNSSTNFDSVPLSS